jgi:hypothetical protein
VSPPRAPSRRRLLHSTHRHRAAGNRRRQRHCFAGNTEALSPSGNAQQANGLPLPGMKHTFAIEVMRKCHEERERRIEAKCSTSN